MVHVRIQYSNREFFLFVLHTSKHTRMLRCASPSLLHVLSTFKNLPSQLQYLNTHNFAFGFMGLTISLGTTALSNSSPVIKPSFKIALRSVVPSLYAFFATILALS